VRQAALDLYYGFSSFIPANVIFGVGLVVLVGVAANSPWGWLVGIALVPVTAGCMALATSLVRDGHTDLGEFAAVLRHPWPALGLGVAQLAIGAVLVVDLMVGSTLGSAVGGVLAVSAVYGLAILWVYAVVAWPIVLDPRRRGEPLTARLRLAAALLVTRPVRMTTLAVLVGIFLAIATILVAAIVTFALALAWLVVAREVLPAADRLEGKVVVASDGEAG
jgi:hypothetical protein